MEETKEEPKHQLRPRNKAINYSEEDEDPADSNIFCDVCEMEYPDGECPDHPVDLWIYVKGIIKIAKSTIEGAGDGVFNILEKEIPVGVMFGPYRGKFIEKANYKKESGYAWELRNEDTGKVVGVVDPGTKPHRKRNWLAYVNSACYLWQQNIVAVQYRGAIWYRVVQPIAPGDELLTHYGPSYSKTLGIHKNYRLTKEEVAALNANVAEEEAKAKPKETKKKQKKGGSGVKSGSGVNTPQGEPVPTGPEDCAASSSEPPSAQLVVPSGNPATVPDRAMRMAGALAKDTTLAYFPCDSCEAIFVNPKGLENHMKWSTTKNGPMRCGEERAKPGPTKARAFKCSLCDKAYTERKTLQRHVEAIHKKIKHACYQCDKSFTQKRVLLQHLRTVHTNVNRRACPTCGQTFTQKGHLDRHIREVHQKLKPHKCDECGKEFGQRQNLKTHTKTVHQGVKPHKCNECGKEFGEPQNLKRHTDTVHQGLKPFACQICGKTFGHKHNMNRHVKAVHQA